MALQTKTFTWGSYAYKSESNAYVLELTMTENSTNQEDNTSNVSYSLVLKSGSNNRFTGDIDSIIKLNGEEVASGTKHITAAYNSSWTLLTGSSNVTHNADGSLNMPIEVSINTYNSYAPPDKTLYWSWSLTSIPRASTISCTTENIESNPTITISMASSSFTHTITYSFGTLKGTIAEKTNATVISDWTIPADFYGQIPSAKVGYGTLTCTTYNGGTEIGTYTCDFTVTTDETKCKPTVSGTVWDEHTTTVALTGDSRALIRYCSQAHCEMTATLNKSAGSFLAKTINNVVTDDDELIIPNVETNVFDFYAKDSREYANTDKVVVPTFIPYIKLTNDATIYRDDPTSGNATLKIEGNYFNGNFGAADNSLIVQYRLKGDEKYTTVTPTIKDNKYSATVSLTGLDYTKAFDFEVVVADKLMLVPKPLTIQKGIPVFDWGENDFNFNVPVTINGVNIMEKLAELEELISS